MRHEKRNKGEMFSQWTEKLLKQSNGFKAELTFHLIEIVV